MELTAVDIRAWLAEDVGDGDLTSLSVIDEKASAEARLLVKEPGVVCGLEPAAAVFAELGARLEPRAADGDVWRTAKTRAARRGLARAALALSRARGKAEASTGASARDRA